MLKLIQFIALNENTVSFPIQQIPPKQEYSPYQKTQ